MKTLSLLVASILALTSVAPADVITLKDGSTVQGDIKRSGDNYIVKHADGTSASIPLDKVSSIQVTTAQGADAAMGRLQSLRRAADNIPDIKQILDRYHTFIDQNAGTPAADAAATDAKVWQERLDQGLVKAGDKWITQAERAELRGKSTDLAILLHDMIKQGRLKEATPILEHSLQIDPQNISLLYVHGVLQYMQEFLPPSRKSFEAVVATAPDHAPSLNNLAVILWRQKAPAAAIGYYDRALLAAPGSVDILDNIAEALNSLPKDLRETLPVKKLVRHFKEQDDVTQKKMAEKGFYRWGSSWLSEKELKKLQDDEQVVKDEIKKLQTDFDAEQKEINTIDSQISQVTNQMNLIEAQSVVQAGNGQFIRIPYPPIYFTLGAQLTNLRNDRATKNDDLDRLRKAAKAALAKMPAPKYSGMQKIIDVDGVPLPAGAKLGQPQPVPPPLPGAGKAPGPVAPPATQPGPTTAPTTQPAMPASAPQAKPALPPTTQPAPGNPRLQQ